MLFRSAKIFGLYPRKGTLAVGADADVVVWDPKKELLLSKENLHMRVDYAAYPEKIVYGAPTHVFSRGELVVENDRFLGQVGRGHFLRRSTFSL